MLAKLFAQLKTLFGFNNKKNEVFDQAVLAVFGVAIDTRIFLSDRSKAEESTEKVAGLAHAWSEAAVKISRVDNGLRDDCLKMVRYFSELQPTEANGLAWTDDILEKAGELLRNGDKLFD